MDRTTHTDTRSHIGAALVAMVVVTLLILRVSGAAFSATTDTTGSSFGTGSISLTDDDGGAALFTVTDMGPGDSATACITVTYNGDFDPGVVKVYAGGLTDSANGLAQYLDLEIEQGALTDTCGLFLAGTTITDAGENLDAFNTDHTAYGTGVGTWDPATDGEARAYQITVTLDAAAPGSVQGESVTDVAFVWETQS